MLALLVLSHSKSGMWEGSSAGALCQERAAVLLLAAELSAFCQLYSSLRSAFFQPYPIPTHPSPTPPIPQLRFPAQGLPAGLSVGQRGSSSLGPLGSFLGTRPGCLDAPIGSWLLSLLLCVQQEELERCWDVLGMGRFLQELEHSGGSRRCWDRSRAPGASAILGSCCPT